jgi:hypothetical protein
MRESKQKTGKGKKPAGRESETAPQDEPKQQSQAEVVDKMIHRFGEKLDADKVNVTVGDFIRLVQFRKEMGEEDPKEIRVTWVDPIEKEHANET